MEAARTRVRVTKVNNPAGGNPPGFYFGGPPITVPGNYSYQAPVPTTPIAAPGTVDVREIGVVGLKQSSGYVWEEYMPQLRGRQGMRVYQTMADSDATVGALLNGVSSLLLAVDWTPTPTDDSPQAKEATDFAQSLMDDMSHTWRDFMSEVLSMLTYGWSFFEIVIKRRMGPDQADASRRSKYNDGLIGIRKLARRAQDSLQQWQIDNAGGLQGMWQLPITGGNLVYIPMERALLFRTRIDKNNPEGFSILRRAYRAWWIKKTIEDYEAIGVERELAGVPVVSIPNDILNSTDPRMAAMREAYLKVARDLKFNEQAGLVIPSDTYPTADGSPSSVPLVKVELMKGAGSTRTIDTNGTIKRWDEAISRTMLADFLMLGGSGGRGSFALSKSKVDLFLKSIEFLLNSVESVLNRYLLPRIWAYNGFDPQYMPTLEPGKIAGLDLAELGTFVQNMSTAGFQLGGDENIEDFLRNSAGMPLKGAEHDSMD